MTEPDVPPASHTPAAHTGMNWKRVAITIALCIPVIGLFYFGLHTDPHRLISPLPGKEAPDFALERMDTGDTVALSAQRGSIVVLNFWASWCEPCRDEHPVLVEVANKYSPRGVKFFGLLVDDTKQNAEKFLGQFGAFPYPTLLPGKSHTSVDYGDWGQPESFIVDRAGIVAYKKTGPWVTGELDAILDSVMRAK